MLEVKNYSFEYFKGKKVINNINLYVKEGDIYAFVGKNGAGKSTTLKSIVGINHITDGDILLDQVSIKEDEINYKKNIAYVPDNPILYEHLTGIQYLDFIADMYEFLIQNHFDRNDMLVALGGGVIGDMTGFCAATYLRGIDFIQIPTSLLAQVDSSVGGKTGVDFRGYKNMVGAFKQPKMVYMNLSTLKTLKEREFLSGMGEVIKYGFIMDRDFLGWLGEHESQIKSLDYDALEYMVKKSCDFKRKVVEIDPKETLGERAKLNLGHTLGHAIEKSLDFGLLHGECVALGMVTSLLISMSKGYISPEEVKEGVQLIAKFNLPVQLPDSFALDVDKVIEITKSDKKMDSGVVKFVLLKEIGEAVVEKTVTLCDMATALETIMK